MHCLSTEGDNKYELRETAITYFADLSIFLKNDIAPIFDQIITEIIKTCNASDEYKDDKKTENPENGPGQGAKFSLDSDSDPDEAELQIDVNHLDEKSAAVNALGVIGQHCPKLC